MNARRSSRLPGAMRAAKDAAKSRVENFLSPRDPFDRDIRSRSIIAEVLNDALRRLDRSRIGEPMTTVEGETFRWISGGSRALTKERKWIEL